jgi:hypothetical protein
MASVSYGAAWFAIGDGEMLYGNFFTKILLRVNVHWIPLLAYATSPADLGHLVLVFYS